MGETATAKERARAVARSLGGLETFTATDGMPAIRERDMAGVADAVSAVWEPLVRDLVDALIGEFPSTRDADAAQDAALARARKALGETNGTGTTGDQGGTS